MQKIYSEKSWITGPLLRNYSRQGWITPEKMRELAQPMIKNQYGQYLLKLAAEFSGKEK